MTTGAEIVARAFRSAGVERLYLFPGGTIAPTLHAWIDLGLPYVVARHEQGAGYAALAASRLAGRPQVVMVTSGPGVTNLLTVLADAYYDSTPLVAVTGQVSTADLRSRPRVRQRGFQEVPTAKLVRGVSKACLRPAHPGELDAMLQEAFHIARSERPGPVVIDLPMDVQRAEAQPAGPEELHIARLARQYPTDEEIEALRERLQVSERPVLLAGQGALLAGAGPELRSLAERCNIPVATSLLGVGAIPGEHPLALGYIGHTGAGWANRAVHEADLLVAVGARLDVRQTGTRTDAFVPRGEVVRIDVDECELQEPRVPAALSIRADARLALDRLLAGEIGAPKAAREAWLECVAGWRKELPLDDYPAGDGCHPAGLLRALDGALRRDAVVVTGVGHHQQWVARHLRFDAPRRVLLTSGGHGAMGYDLPSAVGAALERPESQVVCVVGDGSFQINMQELGTIAEHGLPVKVLVMDNRRLAMVSQFQKITWGRDPSTGDRDPFDFTGFARLYGIPAFDLRRDAEPVRETLERFLSAEGPALLHARIDPACEVSPMLLAGQTMDEMWRWNG